MLTHHGQGYFRCLSIVFVMHLLLKLNKAPASAANDDPTGPSVELAGIRPILYFTGWIDIRGRVF
jgi:hypothetical protein